MLEGANTIFRLTVFESLNFTLASTAKSNAATWVHASPRPAMHVQWAAKIRSSFSAIFHGFSLIFWEWRTWKKIYIAFIFFYNTICLSVRNKSIHVVPEWWNYRLTLHIKSKKRNVNKFCLFDNDWWFLVLNATFNNISAILWRPVLVVEETGVLGEKHWQWVSNW